MSEPGDWKFEFVVENVTAETAQSILDDTISHAAHEGGSVGGGYRPAAQTNWGLVQDEWRGLWLAVRKWLRVQEA